MIAWNGFRGAAKRIEDIDLPRIGHMIGVGEDEIHAVLDVESAGKGFDASGRPKMLFEPHIFYRELKGAKRTQAVKEGLAYASWKPGAYPKDSYPRLAKAMAIDETSALRSASWGLGQIMGFNYEAAGFRSPQDMVRAFMEDEDRHLEGMVAFIKNSRLDDDLRRHDWAGFARGYNGAGFAKHGYHTKLAAAYAKWKRIPDTPWSPGAVEKAWEADNTPMFDVEPAKPVAPVPPAPEPVQGQPDDPGPVVPPEPVPDAYGLPWWVVVGGFLAVAGGVVTKAIGVW